MKKGSPRVSSRSSPSPDKGQQLQSIRGSPLRESIKQDHTNYSGLVRSPVHKPPASDEGRKLSRSPSPDGVPKRIRKGRGFSERFAFARRYRTPSPVRSPVRSQYYRGRNERGRDHVR